MSLPLGSWTFNVNGAQDAPLILQAVAANGILSGTYRDFAVIGFWDEGAQSITFTLQKQVINVNNELIGAVVLPEAYKGWLFSTPQNPEPGQDISWTIAGYFLAWNSETKVTATARRTQFGWFAQLLQVV